MATIICKYLGIETKKGITTKEFIDALEKLCKELAKNGKEYHFQFEEEA